MTLILGGTFLAGLVMTYLLMLGGVNVLAVRYAVAVAFAYLMFLVFIRLWLSYVGSGGETSIDVVSETADSIELAATVDSGSSKSSSLFDLSIGDVDDWLVMLILLLLVALLLAFGIYFIYTAPALLTEAAFEALLAGAVARRAKQVARGNWVGAVWRATVWPFVIVLVLSTALGWAIQRRCPEATRLRDAFHCAPANRQPFDSAQGRPPTANRLLVSSRPP
jgi:hypothetical protein